jgi:hypothetical protein
LNYQRIHDQIIAAARERGMPSGYCERHHVIPRSMGGTNDATNLVRLTGREHYLIHWMLFKIHRYQETAFAWFRMTHTKESCGRYTSYTYEYAKRAKSEFQSRLFAGRTLSEEHRRKLSEAKRGRSYSDQGRDPATSRKGQTLTPEQKARIGAASRGRKASDETRKKLSASKTGHRNPRYGKPALNAKRKELEQT